MARSSENIVRHVKQEIYALYLAYKDPRVPWYAKLFAACVVAYAFSPIDLIPDSIPILGYLDDAVLIPLGVFLAAKMIPDGVLVECRQKARKTLGQDRPTHWVVASIIVTIWVIAAGVVTILMIWMLRPWAN